MNWREAASTVRWNIQPFINGRYRASATRELFDNINPATEQLLCRFPVGDAADIDEGVRIAGSASNDGCWSEIAAASAC